MIGFLFTASALLHLSCDHLKGVGPTLLAKLAACGLFTLQDLLFHLPYRYQDRTRFTPIQDVRANDWCVISGKITKTEIVQGKRSSLIAYLSDQTGIIRLRFFHFNKDLINRLNQSEDLCVFGEVRQFSGQFEMIHPEYQILKHDAPIIVPETLTPLYATTHGLSQNKLRQFIHQALNLSQDYLIELEWLSKEELKAKQMLPLAESLMEIHHPPPDVSLDLFGSGKHPGLMRLAFDELLAQQISLLLAKKTRSRLKAPALPADDASIQDLLKSLPFQLTSAQIRVQKEISKDLIQSKPMLRLLQGDVGSGKTLIAAMAAVQAIASGHQVAFMVPTDILSEQHTKTLKKFLSPLNINVHRLSGKMKNKDRQNTLLAISTHQASLVVGTHALFQEHVQFAHLGLIIIDEQHRFGVKQRILLQEKANHNDLMPHQLLMTATPIPRTLTMTYYAHMDLSILDELPSGRIPVKTAILHQDKRIKIIERLQTVIDQGCQAYWVCTLIDESEHLQAINAIATHQELQTLMPNLNIGLIHGRMKSLEKEQIMNDFTLGKIQLLVATTVIEVGVDVPNASLMIIDNAERLGLSQLHQLRGRVGRGTRESHCLLLYQLPLSPEASARLKILRASSDGFLIAEKDRDLRGSGEFLGIRQTGHRPFKIACLDRDHHLIKDARTQAAQLLNENHVLAEAIAKRWLGEFEHFINS